MTAKEKVKKPLYKKWWFWTIIVVIVIAYGSNSQDDKEAASVDGKNDTEVTTTANEQEEDKPEKESEETESEKSDTKEKEVSVGDTVTFDDLDITLNGVRVEAGGEFDEPEEDQFLVANLTIKNNSDEEKNISSIMNIELKDDQSYGYNTTFLTEGTKGQLDGSIEPGGEMRGEIPFDTAESDRYELHFSDPFSTGKAIWTIPKDIIE